MTKSFRESVEEILEGIELDDDGACGDPECCGSPSYHVSEDSLKKAKAALIEVVQELIPQKATPLSKTRPLSKRNVGWNEAITALLKKMEE